MNKWILAIMIAGTFAVQAKQLKTPDENTLWMEDGKDIELTNKTETSRWNNVGLEIQSKTDGRGFSFLAKDGKGRRAVTYVNFSPEYRYLTFRIIGLDFLQGYRCWAISAEGRMMASQVTSPQKGIYVFDMFQNLLENSPTSRAGAGALKFWVYNLRVNLEYIKMIKNPPYIVRVECADPEIKPGSKVKFTAELEKEAEDVSLSLITAGVPYNVKINGTVKIQLKPADKTQKIWTAEVDVKSIGIKKALQRHQIFMKMDVLGGDLDEPVWVGLPYQASPK